MELKLFKDLSETAKQKALKNLTEPLIKIGNTFLSTEELKECIDECFFFDDGTLA